MKKYQLTSLLIALVLVIATFTPMPVSAGSPCTIANGGWSVLYTIQFPPAYWTAGPHENDLNVDDSSVSTFTAFYFNSTPDAPLYPGQVRLGFWGIHSSSQAGLTEINPAQDSFMQVTMNGFLSRQDAVAYAQSAAIQFRWDGGDWVTVEPGPINCAPNAWSGQTGYYMRIWAN